MTQSAADASAVIEDPSWWDAVERRTAIDVRVSTVDHLRGITPTMFGWWFANMTAETYQDFHPRDHAAFAWTRDKRPGEYLGATHRTHHRYGGTGPVMRSEITFVPPVELFPPTALTRLGGGHALAAVVHPLDEDDTPLVTESARFVHVALPRDYGSELRCRWWLSLPENAGDADLDRVTVGRIRHVHEEFGYLQEFLPALYAARPGQA
jgi:DAPG hydrolase PhiG domain